MVALLLIAWPMLLVLAGAFGYFCLGPWSSGYRAFTSPDAAAEDQVYRNHPERRTRRWKP